MSTVEQLLLAHYRDAAQRMGDIPLYNSMLEVELVAWQTLDQSGAAGILVTPWCVNLLWVPLDQADMPVKGEPCVLALESGEYEGVCAELASVGRYGSAALISDTSVMIDQEQARALANEMAALIFAPAVSHDAQASEALAQGKPENPQRRALFRRALGGAQ
ncbi:MAG: hydrogenase expression/formation protein HoxT [Oceanospirillaceae bacterium]|nr:hydrogenase expression/formation protein HoxT [Oceanospirillaceae bacterium]